MGFASALDVANADANVATTEAQIPVFETAAQQSIYALSVLLARPPADLLEQLSPTGNLPSVPAQVPAGLPSDLLRRRPDIRHPRRSCMPPRRRSVSPQRISFRRFRLPAR